MVSGRIVRALSPDKAPPQRWEQIMITVRTYDQDTLYAIQFIETLIEEGIVKPLDKEALRRAILEHYPPRVHVMRT